MLEERAGYSPLSFSTLFGPAELTCVGRITGSSVWAVLAGAVTGVGGGGERAGVHPRDCASQARGGLLCRSRFTSGPGTPPRGLCTPDSSPTARPQLPGSGARQGRAPLLPRFSRAGIRKSALAHTPSHSLQSPPPPCLSGFSVRP